MGEQVLIPGTNDYATATATATSCGNSTNKKRSSAPSRSTAKAQATASRISDKPSSEEQLGALKCPRCDSSNTKFCYYNNYSFTQPRHFCKACKRYWTRGGTLRNVPVGGGCRKNKRVKKQAAALATATATVGAGVLTSNRHRLLPASPMTSFSISPSTASTSHIYSSLLHVLHSSCAVSLPLPTVCDGVQIHSSSTTAFDLQSQLNELGIGFSSVQCDDEYQLGHQLQQRPLVNSEVMPPLTGHGSMNSANSLLISSLKQSKKDENYQCLPTYEELHASALNHRMFKNVKLEGSNLNNAISCSDQYQWKIPSEISTTGLGAFRPGAVNGFNSLATDSFYQLSWNTAAGDGGGWPDIASCGSSVAPPLI